MLRYEEYLSLEEDLQTQILSLDGVFMELRRKARELNVELYALYGFYVEIFFDSVTEEPLYLKPFRKMKYLEPYLVQVNIGELQG